MKTISAFILALVFGGSAFAAMETDINFKQGEDFLYQAKWDEAALEFEKVLAVEPANPGALYNLACALACKGEYDRAVEKFQQALPLEKEKYFDALIYSNIGAIYYKRGLTDRDAPSFALAAQNFKKAAELMPETAGSFRVLVEYCLAYSHKDILETGATIKYLLDEKGEAYDSIVLSQEVMGTEKESDRHFSIETSSLPMLYFYHSPAANLFVALQYYELKQYNHVNRLLNLALDRLRALKESRLYKLDMYLVLVWKAMVFKQRGESRYVLEFLQDAQSLNYRDFPSTHVGLADAYMNMGEYIKAKEEAQKALQIQSDYPPALNFMKKFEGVSIEENKSK